MNKETLDAAYAEIENFKEKLGENFLDAIMEYDNSTYDMAKGIISVYRECKTERDFQIANDMLEAVCGYSFGTLIERIQELDENGHQWESC